MVLERIALAGENTCIEIPCVPVTTMRFQLGNRSRASHLSSCFRTRLHSRHHAAQVPPSLFFMNRFSDLFAPLFHKEKNAFVSGVRIRLWGLCRQWSQSMHPWTWFFSVPLNPCYPFRCYFMEFCLSSFERFHKNSIEIVPCL